MRIVNCMVCGVLAACAIACKRERSEPPPPIAQTPAVAAPLREAPAVSSASPSSPEFYATAPADAIEEAVMDRVLSAIGNDWQREAAIVQRLSPGMRAFYTSRVLDNEVRQGGFHQYFWDSSGALAEEALAGLELMGAKQHAALLREAMELARAEEPLMRKLKESGTQEAFKESYKHTKQAALDKRFYGLKSLSAYRMEYVRSHPQQFVPGQGTMNP
jgi:hypothetical protein